VVDYLPGDQVVCLIRDKAIVNASDLEYDLKAVFDVLTTYAEGLILYVPRAIQLDDCMFLNVYNCDRFNLDHKFLNSLSYYITEYKVYEVYQQIDGLCCNRCKDFFPMATGNQKDGTLLCFSCRQNPWR
jgi:hypothetical protein